MRIKTLALSALLAGCSTVSQIPDASHVYKRQLEMTVNGVKCPGVCVVKQALSYKIHVEASRIDYGSIETCHRKVSVEDKNDSWDYTYSPQSLEIGCPIEVVTLDKKNAKNGFGLIDIESSDYQMKAKLTCDGVLTEAQGSSICQSKAGLNQSIEFDSPVVVHPDPNCPLEGPSDGRKWVFKLVKGMCVYVWGSKQGFFKLTTIGTDDLILQKL